MPYSPPPSTAVDFNGTGQVVYVPRWDRVHFSPSPSFLAWSDGDIAPDIAGQANHQVAWADAALQPDIAGQAWKTFFASADYAISADTAGLANYVYQASSAASIHVAGVGLASYVYLATCDAAIDADIAGSAFWPEINAHANVALLPDIAGLAVRGVAAFGYASFSPEADGDMFRVFRASSDASIQIDAECVAAFSPAAAARRASAIASFSPVISGVASV